MGSRSSSQQSLPGWAVDTAKSLLGSTADVVAPGQTVWGPDQYKALPLAQMPEGLAQQVAPFNDAQRQGLAYLTNSAGTSAQLAGQGAQQLGNTLSGAYLDPASNPYLQQTYNAAARNLTDVYRDSTAPSQMVAAQQAGVAGGSAQMQDMARGRYDLGENLSNLATQIYGGNYQTERGRQFEAPQMLGAMQQAIAAPGQQLLGAGTLEQGQAQTELDTAQKNAELRTQYPYTLLSYLGNMLGTATGGGGQVVAGTSK